MVDCATSIDIEAPPEVVFAHLVSAERMVTSPASSRVAGRCCRPCPTTPPPGVAGPPPQGGIESFDEARLRSILASDVSFEGPIAGKRTGVESFLRGLADFVKSVSALRMLQQIHAGNEAAALYDCDLGTPAGTLRFGEFIRVENGRILAIRLVYDPTEFRKLTP